MLGFVPHPSLRRIIAQSLRLGTRPPKALLGEPRRLAHATRQLSVRQASVNLPELLRGLIPGKTPGSHEPQLYQSISDL